MFSCLFPDGTELDRPLGQQGGHKQRGGGQDYHLLPRQKIYVSDSEFQFFSPFLRLRYKTLSLCYKTLSLCYKTLKNI